MMRTGVTLEMERQNSALLDDMNRRNRLQMRLNRMVQGISLAGLAYYLIGLFSYLARGMKALGVLPKDISAETASAFALPGLRSLELLIPFSLDPVLMSLKKVCR